jgi:S-adenosylmethionine:tRNA ribosyltransferase-isomerase
MHFETYEVNEATLARLDLARREGRRVIAVGTTSLRVLESLDTFGPVAKTNLFISPGYHFRRATALITNFHLPKSSLYVLVSAFLGLRETRDAYTAAIQERYRFYSYGDAMWIH